MPQINSSFQIKLSINSDWFTGQMCNQIFVLPLDKTNFKAVKVKVLQSHKNDSTKQNIFANFRIAGWDVITFAKKNSKTMVTEAENSKNGFSGRKMQIFASKHFS